MTDKKRAGIEIHKIPESSKPYYWALVKGDNTIVYARESWKRRQDAVIAAHKARRLMAEAEIEEGR